MTHFYPASAFSEARPLKKGNLCSSSRKVKISTTGIYRIFRGLKFEPDAEIGQKVPFCRGLEAYPLKQFPDHLNTVF